MVQVSFQSIVGMEHLIYDLPCSSLQATRVPPGTSSQATCGDLDDPRECR